ncbi:MAG: hypothetical protein KDA28_13480, partial [Phycisphaerales bacterium]|nr:hypothetical protein [Phycisphaerales bacterium]
MRRPLILAIAAGAASAQNATWNADSGNWSESFRWLNSDIADQPTENAVFPDRGSPYTVTMDGNYEIASLQFLDPDASLHIPNGRVLGINGPF